MKLKQIVVASTLVLSLLSFQSTTTNAATTLNTHTVQKGDTFYLLGKKYGVSVIELKKMNNKTSDMIYPGEKLVIPKTITATEKDLLARLVQAEAKGESYAGKVAVATVVLNRVDHESFPNTIKEVIYETYENGSYAFSPVQNGQINNQADEISIKAVEEALAFRGQGNGSLFFYNPAKTTNQWIYSKEVTITIGNHVFAK